MKPPLSVTQTPHAAPLPPPRLPLPAKLSALGLMPASRLEVPKSEIFSTPL